MALHFAAEQISIADKGLRCTGTKSQQEIDKVGLGFDTNLHELI